MDAHLSLPVKKLSSTSAVFVQEFVGFVPLDEVVAFRAVFVIVSGSDGRAESLLELPK